MIKYKLKVKVSSYILDAFIKYIIMYNGGGREKGIRMIGEFVDLVDHSPYEQDMNYLMRCDAIRRMVQMHKEGKSDLYSQLTICEDERFEAKYDEIRKMIDACAGEEVDSKFVHEYISSRMKLKFLYVYKDEIVPQFNKLNDPNISNILPIGESLLDSLERMRLDLRGLELSDEDTLFSDFDTSNLQDGLERTLYGLNKGCTKLYTGITALNNMVEGAFRDRVYMLYGASGGGKSIALATIGAHFKLFNKDVKTKNPGLKPEVLLVTMENSVIDTIKRMYTMFCGDGPNDRMEYHDIEDVRQRWDKGGLNLSPNNPINLKVVYIPQGTAGVQDLDELIRDRHKEGFEPIALVVDYVDTLLGRRNKPNQDDRLRLGDIVMDLHSLALKYGIPVVSASQLNREGCKILDEAEAANVVDRCKLIGRSHVAESFKMITNSDYSIIINREDHATTKIPHMTFKLVKERGTKMDGGLSYFNQPMDITRSAITLQPDINLPKSLAVKSLKPEIDQEWETGSGIKRKRVNSTSNDFSLDAWA